MPITIQSLVESIRHQYLYRPVLPTDDVNEEKDALSHEAIIVERHRSPRILLALVALLSIGWAATLIGWYKMAAAARPPDNGPLHVYHNTPIPKEVFLPVKKVFEPDERYVGGGPEVGKHWDALVAGMFPRSSKLFSTLHYVQVVDQLRQTKATTRCGSRIRSNGDCPRGLWLPMTTPTRLTQSRRTFMSFRFCISFIVW